MSMFHDTYKADRKMKDSEIIKRLLVYASAYKTDFIIALFLLVLSVIYSIVSPYLIGQVEEMVKTTFSLSTLGSCLFLYGGVLLVSVVASYLEAVILQKTGQKLMSSLREDLFTHIESLSHDQLHHIPTGKLVTRVTNDTNALSELFTTILVKMIKNAFILIGVIIAMFVLNVKLALLVMCFFPIVVLMTVVFRMFSRQAYRKVKDGFTDINTFLSENLSGMKVTQIFNAEDKKLSEFRDKNTKLKKALDQEIIVFSVFRPMIYALYIASILALFYVGGMGYLDGLTFAGQAVSSGIIVSFYMYVTEFFSPIQEMAEQFNKLQGAFASAEKIFSILDIEPEIVDQPDAMDVVEIHGEIEFQNVWFAYEEGNWVLRDVSFHISPGETVALVGSTGSGKTTILSLLCRNYDIQKGQILIDGTDIKKYKIASLRKHFGQMLQDVFLFSGTIRSNIVLSRKDLTDDDIWEACEFVNADRFIEELPNQLDEEVRERGNNFSAGQRQLISFARTIIHKPSVMILDEATANIDTETETLIQDTMTRIMSIGTMLIVAHRLSTIQHSDRIMVIEKGKIVESGTHQELLELKGKYFELYQLQV